MMRTEPTHLPSALRRRHQEMLLIALLVLFASFILEVHPDETVGLMGQPNLLLPPMCFSRAWFDLPCPGCGLTRCFIYLVHGDWEAARRAHGVGWVLAVALFIQIPYRIRELRFPDRPLLSRRATKWFGNALISLLVLHWLVELMRLQDVA